MGAALEMVVQALELQQGAALETQTLALELIESLQLRTEGLVQQQVSESQRVGLELSLKQQHSAMVVYLTLTLKMMYSVLILSVVSSILTLRLMTPQETLPQKPLHNLHASSAGDDQCEHNAVGDQLSPGKSMVLTVLSLYLEPTSLFLPGYFTHSPSHVVTVHAI